MLAGPTAGRIPVKATGHKIRTLVLSGVWDLVTAAMLSCWVRFGLIRMRLGSSMTVMRRRWWGISLVLLRLPTGRRTGARADRVHRH